jgi:hypothetical protein
MAKVQGRCWPHDVPFTAVTGVDGKPYVRDGFVCESRPGDFKFKDGEHQGISDPIAARVMEFNCPHTGKYCGSIRVGYPAKPEQSPSWKWDGNFEKPTLHPSINCRSGCGWHGWLKAGSFED